MSVLECLKSIWDFSLDDDGWFESVGTSLVPLFDPLGANLGLLAIDFSWGEDGGLGFRPRLHLETEIAGEDVLEFVRSPPDLESMLAFFSRAPWSGTMVEVFNNEPKNHDHVLGGAGTLGVADTVGLVAGDARGGTQFFAMSSHIIEPTTKERWVMSGLTAHISAAFRLRRDLRGEPRVDDADAVLNSDGDLLDAGAHGDSIRTVRQQLRQTVAKQRATRDARALSENETFDAWASLVDGRYSIVDHHEERGRRLFLLYENPYFFRSPRALSVRQRDVVALAARGQDNGTIGMTLGVSPSTVASHLSSALQKLGLANRSQLSRYLDWEKAVVQKRRVGENLEMIDVRADAVDCSALTEAELDVARRAARGASNEEIAEARKSRPRTVANQLASVYSKLAINSRQELARVID